jgi:peptidoglycan LD-endopeptidase LytH
VRQRSGALVATLLLAACSGGLTPLPPATMPTPVGARPSHVGPLSSVVTDADLDALWTRQLIVPVEGIRREMLRDNYTAARDKGIHAALDILAPRATPVLSADDGVIGRLITGNIGGIALYATDPDARFVYYYAHLDRYRPGLSAGDRVAKGEVIGYVGTTGNAPPNTPHLHFQIMKRGTGRAWWDGPPINPISFFAGEMASRRLSPEFEQEQP